MALLEQGWTTMLLTIVLSLGGLAVLIALALRADHFADVCQPVDANVTDDRELLKLQLMRGDISADEYLDRVSAMSEGHHA